MARVRKHTHLCIDLPPEHPAGSKLCVICDEPLFTLSNLMEPQPDLTEWQRVQQLAFVCIRAAVRDERLSTEAAVDRHKQHDKACPHRGPVSSS